MTLKLFKHESHLLQRQELVVLELLKWDTFSVTPSDFLDQILARLSIIDDDDAQKKIRRRAETFIIVCVISKQSDFPLFVSGIGGNVTGLNGVSQTSGEQSTAVRTNLNCVLAAEPRYSVCAPSILATACIRLAVEDVMGTSWFRTVQFDRRLEEITSIDFVSSSSDTAYLALHRMRSDRFVC